MKILIIGAGISALSAYELALKVDDDPYLLIDKNEINKVDNKNYYFNDDLPKIIDLFELFIISPGVYYDDKRLILLKEKKKRILSEIDYSYLNIKRNVTIIAVTGSNGKTTIIEWLYYVLLRKNKNVYKAGNIGIPFSSIVLDLKENDFVLLELSNFQLDYSFYIKPQISIITNISENHLDKMQDFNYYVSTKLKIYQNMGVNDYLLINSNLENIVKYKGNIIKIKDKINNRIFNKNIVCNVLKILNIKVSNKFIKSFKGVKYRNQKISKNIYHDGKSTTPSSTLSAIKSIKKRNELIVIIGGRNKNLSFAELLKEKVKYFIVYGELSNLIKGENIINVKTLKEALDKYDLLKNKKTILLYSPACTSFDQYNNYIERCEEFNKLIRGKKYV